MIIFLGDAGIKSLCRVADTADGRPFGELFGIYFGFICFDSRVDF